MSREARLHERIPETHTGHRLGATRVCNADELCEELSVLGVVPVAEDDGVLFIIRVLLCWGMDDDRGTKAVDVLALQDNERGI